MKEEPVLDIPTGSHEAPRPRLASGLLWLLLTALLLLPLLSTAFPPLYDYYHWVFDGHIVSRLLFHERGLERAFAYYTLQWKPIPNLATPLFLAVLDRFIPPLESGRILLIFSVLAFSYSFAFLVRSAQGRPTAVEFLGCLWAYGYFLYKGYLSYLISLALCFFAVGLLLRFQKDPERASGARALVVFAPLGVLIYFCHLMGWAVFVLATLVFAFDAVRRGARRAGLLLAATAVPATALLTWYLVLRNGEHSGADLAFYASIPDKVRSLMQALFLFLRTDPFPAPFPVFWANVLAFGLLGVVVAMSVKSVPNGIISRPLVGLGVLLGVISVLTPFSDAGGMGRPDERFVLPALLITIAGLRHKAWKLRPAVIICCIVCLVLAAHVAEYRQSGRALERVSAWTRSLISPGERAICVTIQKSALEGSCEPAFGYSVGIPVRKWFEVVRLLDTGRLAMNLMSTSVLHKQFQRNAPHDLFVMTVPDMREWARHWPHTEVTRQYPVIEIFGCGNDVDAAVRDLSPIYHVAARDEWGVVLRAGPAGPRRPHNLSRNARM
jgi:hypothetical protein